MKLWWFPEFIFQNNFFDFGLVLVGPSEASTASSSGVTAHQVQNPRGILIPVSAYALISLNENGTHHKGWHISDLLYNTEIKCEARQNLLHTATTRRPKCRQSGSILHHCKVQNVLKERAQNIDKLAQKLIKQVPLARVCWRARSLTRLIAFFVVCLQSS